MTGPTHKQYSVTGAFLVSMLIYDLSLSEVHYYIALPILLMTAKCGALFPDVDHHWKSVSDKTVPNWIINKIIHMTGGKHRSWQTHSIDIVVIASLLSYYMPLILYNKGLISSVNREVMSIMCLGFMSGWVSHLFSDMLTSAGVRIVACNKFKVALVPKSIGSLRFNTGHEWEAFNFKVIKGLNMVLGTICMIYPFIHGNLSNILTRVVNGGN